MIEATIDDKPWLADPQYGGMSPYAAEKSWRTTQQRRAQLEALAVEPSDYESLPINGPAFDPEDPGYHDIPDQADALEASLVPNAPMESQRPLSTTTPLTWRDVPLKPQAWLAEGRIPSGDLTILSGNGGAGKTEIAVALLVNVAAGLGDWLGCVVDAGPSLFLSCEEDEDNVRDRAERICRHRGIDLFSLSDLHLHFPDLDDTWLCRADRNGRVHKTDLFNRLETSIKHLGLKLVVIDSVAAVFDGEAVARRQVRSFLAMLRKIARANDVAIVLLDHPSVRGMADGSGTANSVDWRNSVRSMLHLSDPNKDDPDTRELEVKKTNRSRVGEKTVLKWNGLTFTTAAADLASPYRAAAERDIDELFLRLLDKRNTQKRPVHAKNAKGSAPSEFADDPDANGVRASAFRASMERLLTAGRITVVETGPASKRRTHLERSPS